MDIKKILRKKILKNEHCKFELLKKLIPLEELLTEKPLLLREEIADRLDIKVADIKPKAFREWRRRLKLKNKKIGTKGTDGNSTSKATHEQTFNIDTVNDAFTPLTPEPKKENIEDYIIPVKADQSPNTT